MPTMQDIFAQRPFRTVEMTAGLRSIPFQPGLLGRIPNLFKTVPIVGSVYAISQTTSGYALIPQSAIGEPPVQLEGRTGSARAFTTGRLAKSTTFYPRDLVGVLMAPMAEAIVSAQQEIAQRSIQIRQDVEYTNEYLKFGCVLGKTVDADGLRVIDDWFANWGVAEPAVFDFELDDETTNLKDKCTLLRDQMKDAADGNWIAGVSKVHALAGRVFYDDFFNHKYFRDTMIGTAAAVALRELNPDREDRLGIDWHRYDGPTSGAFGIAEEEVRFFPSGVPETFQKVLGSAEFMPWVFQPGQDLYTLTIPDRDRDAWTKVEFYQYPSYACLRPGMLRKGIHH